MAKHIKLRNDKLKKDRYTLEALLEGYEKSALTVAMLSRVKASLTPSMKRESEWFSSRIVIETVRMKSFGIQKQAKLRLKIAAPFPHAIYLSGFGFAVGFAKTVMSKLTILKQPEVVFNNRT